MVFKKGDRVKVKSGRTDNSRKLNGRIGVVIEVCDGFCHLDIEKELTSQGGLWNDELSPVRLKVGDKVEFIFDGYTTHIPTYYTDSDGIPGTLIVHGGTDVGNKYKINKAEIVAKYNEYFIVEYDGNNNKKVRLGFKAESLKILTKSEQKTHIILWNDNHYIVCGKKERDEMIKKLVDDKEVDNDYITIFDITNESKVVCKAIVKEI